MSTSAATETRTPAQAGGPRAVLARRWAATARFRPVLLILVVLFTFFSITQDGFFDATNLKNLLTGASMLWILSIAMTFVLISGGFDLSAGAILVLSGIFLAKVLSTGLNPWVAVILTVAFGALVGGVINGVLIGHLRLNFFVVTLASMTALTGVVNLWSETKTEFVHTPLIGTIGIGEVWGLPTPIWLMIGTAVIGLLVQHRTYLGRDIFAVGGSAVAARLAGIRTGRTIVIVYAISGGAAALAGIIAVGRIGAASPQMDMSLALNAAAAVMLGGTSLMGGSGGIGGTIFGVLFIGVLSNGLSIAGVEAFWQQVVTGVILVLAVLGDRGDAAGLRRLIGRLRSRGRDGDTPPAPGGPGGPGDRGRPITPDLPAATAAAADVLTILADDPAGSGAAHGRTA